MRLPALLWLCRFCPFPPWEEPELPRTLDTLLASPTFLDALVAWWWSCHVTAPLLPFLPSGALPGRARPPCPSRSRRTGGAIPPVVSLYRRMNTHQNPHRGIFMLAPLLCLSVP